MKKKISDFLSPGLIVSKYLLTPEYFIFEYCPMLPFIPVYKIKDMIEKLNFNETEVIVGTHSATIELIQILNSVQNISNTDYKEKIVEWYKNIKIEDNFNLRQEFKNKKRDEAKNQEKKQFNKSLIVGGKVVFCDIGGYPEKVVDVINNSNENHILLSEDYSLKKDNERNIWIIYKNGEKVYLSPYLYVDGIEDFIKIRNGVYPTLFKKKRYTPKLLRFDDIGNFLKCPLDYIFDINNYVETNIKNISAGSIMAYMNRVFGPSNFSGDYYKDMCGSWIVTTPEKNMVLKIHPSNTSRDFSCLWFRFYLKKNIDKDNLKEIAYYTSIMKQTLDYFLRPVNERDVFFNIEGQCDCGKNSLKPHWASTLSLSFFIENKESFNEFCNLLNNEKGKDNSKKFKNLIKRMKK